MASLLNQNSVALVTASSAGLGAAIAHALAASGVRIVINYHSDRGRAQQLLQELEALKLELKPDVTQPRFLILQADCGNRDEVVRLVHQSVESMGRLDLVVSNHGWTKIRNFSDLDDNMEESDWDRCYNMNVKSHLFLFHEVKKHLEKTDGSFITTASLAGVKPSGSSMAYSVTKAAQIHLVKTLAMTSTIRVNSVSPGMLMTDWGRQFPQSKLDASIAKSTLKRLATVEDVARQVVCLANSSSITGTNTVIDCGVHLSK